MKDIVKIAGKVKDYTLTEIVNASAIHILVALLGFTVSRSVVLGSLLPFGLSFLAGCPLWITPSAAIGVFLGYFFPAFGSSGFRYIAALFAILAIKFLLSNYKKIVSNQYFCVLICGLSCLLTNAVALKSQQVNVLNMFCETLLCAASTYFFARSFNALSKKASPLATDELTALLISLSIIISGFISVNISGISLGRILAFVLVLTSAKYGGIISGAVSGVSVALILSLTGSGESVALALAVSGLMAGVFCYLGKYAQVTALLIFCFIGSVSGGDVTVISRTIVEAALAAALFLTLPRPAGIILSKFFSASPQISLPSNIKKSLTMRLEVASGALRDVSKTVDRVSNELKRINAPDFGAVVNLVEQDACAGCKLRIHCWETKRQDTVNAILEMTKAVKQGECAPETKAPTEFVARCLRCSAVANATYKRYSDYASRIAAENRIDEVRSVVSDQFDGISDMLYDLSLDFKNDQKFDNSAAENAASALKNLDLRVEEASSRIDKYGRMTLEFRLKKYPELVINKMTVMKTLSVVCERDFDVPQISEVGGNIYITVNEHPCIKIDIGVEQIAASNSSMCGDAYRYFKDGKGHFIMILSDGMGTGGRAAVDGAMASGLMSRLLKAGFGYDCSLRILNSSMLFKSTDESLATVDIASIDLFTGKTELYKAGAAPSIIRRSGKTGKAESTSLPAGILREIGFDKACVRCKYGDIVVLLSDGMTATGTDWIRAELEAWQDGSAQELAQKLCECAKRRRNDNHRDDITVMAAILQKS